MRIDRLFLDGFGRFRDASLELRPGLNILCGANEAGKSTIHEFIRAMLYGFSKPGLKRSRMLDSYEGCRPWEGGAYRGRLILSLDDGRQFRVERDFHRYVARLCDDVSGSEQPLAHDGRGEPTFASEWLRLSQGEFSATVCIGQLFTSEVEPQDARDLAARMAALQSTGREDESANRALGWLDERLAREVGTYRAKVRSPLGTAQVELDQADAVLRKARALRAENLTRELRVKDLAAEIARLRQQQAQVSQSIQGAEGQALLSRLDGLERQLAAIRAQEAAAGQAGETVAALAAFAGLEPGEAERVQAYFADYERAQGEAERIAQSRTRRRQEVDQLRSDLARTGISGDPMEIEAKLDALQTEVDRLKYRAQMGRDEAGGDSGKLILWAAAAAAILFGLVLGAAVHPAAVLSALAAVPFIWMALRSGPRSAGTDLSSDLEARNRELQQFLEAHGGGGAADVKARLRRFTALKAQLEAVAAPLAELEGSGPSGGGLEGARDRLFRPLLAVAQADPSLAGAVAAQRVSREIIDLFGRLSRQYQQASLEQTRAREAVEQAWSRITDEITALAASHRDLGTELLAVLADRAVERLARQIQAVRAELGPVPVGAADPLDELERQRAALAEQVQERVAEHAELQGMIRKAYEDMPDLPELERRQQVIRERIDGLLLQQRALERAKRVISAVAAEMHRDFAPRLARRVAPIISTITGGRYGDVRLNEELELTTEVPETRQLRSVEDLSLGTLDQFYLALRVGAALELTAGGERPFLLCDDSLVQYDDRRAEACLRYLAQLAPEHQVILLTCHRREALLGEALGAHVIELGGPAHG